MNDRRFPVTQSLIISPLPVLRAPRIRGGGPLVWCAAGLLAFIIMVPLFEARAQAAPESFADLAERLLPAVVNISSTQVSRERSQRGPEIPQFPPGSPFEDWFRDFLERNRPESTPRRVNSLGSGFIIDPSGYIVTNNHVIEEADEITVILQDDTNLKATIVGRDKKTDLALLKVETDKPLTAVEWGDSNKSRVGDWVVAIGNPFGLGGTVTAGIISARARDINSGPYDDYLQTDASINRGNSGGPMFNIEGEVIGVNTAIFSPSGGSVGIGFAIPSALAKTVIDQLRKHGRTRRGWLGVRIQTVTEEIAESLGLEKARGALVAGVTDGGPAKESGIEAGDVILRFDDKEVSGMRKLPRIVAETPIDKAVEVVLWRKGEKKVIDVTIGELKEDVALKAGEDKDSGQGTVSMLGLTLSVITPKLRERFKLDDETKGIIVTRVKNGSVAKKKGIRKGDVILEVSQDKVETPGDVKSMVEKARSAKRKSVLLLIERQNDQRFVVLPIAKS
ncbi:MAG: DegQ family serine endoprotease [Proteobacteria bacterium]|nr:DegQ family serine endoprotease [Pseudomonadota bacterium]